MANSLLQKTLTALSTTSATVGLPDIPTPTSIIQNIPTALPDISTSIQISTSQPSTPIPDNDTKTDTDTDISNPEMKFLILSSRPLNIEEKEILQNHGTLFEYNKHKHYGNSVSAISSELKPDFWFFNLGHRSHRDFLHSGLFFFQNFQWIILRQNFENQKSEWISEIKNLQPTIRIVKYIPENICSMDFKNNLKNCGHIPIPKSRTRVYSEKLLTFLYKLL